ncbi:hypothetical protein V2V06_21205 [Paenibacillus polymyxa]|nr:hypothetical protein [Paenibacillus polymyxa]
MPIITDLEGRAPTCVAHYAKDRSTRLVNDGVSIRPYSVREYAISKGEIWMKDWMQGMKNKFCGVIKHEDAVKYLNDKDKAYFNYLCHKIECGRKNDGKLPVNAYLVINVDEPYAEEVAEILKRHGHWE